MLVRTLCLSGECLKSTSKTSLLEEARLATECLVEVDLEPGLAGGCRGKVFISRLSILKTLSMVAALLWVTLSLNTSSLSSSLELLELITLLMELRD